MPETSNHRRRLLESPDRRESILPELVRFFSGNIEEVLRFAQTFHGCVEMRAPTPKMVDDLLRDERIADRISANMDNDARVDVCRTYQVRPRHLMELCLIVHSREMHNPAKSATFGDRVMEARRLIKRFAGCERIVMEMLELRMEQIREWKPRPPKKESKAKRKPKRKKSKKRA